MIYNPQQMNYTAQIPYLLSRFIYEYDISKANINILYAKGIIDLAEYEYIKALPKEQRQVYVGMMQKDREKAVALQEGLAEYREAFLTKNNIQDIELLSVKNDAIFLIDRQAAVTKFGNVEFILKNRYTSFFKLSNTLEVYYTLNPIDNSETIDVKGINDKMIEAFHGDYMIHFLCECFYYLQTRNIEESIKFVTDFYNQYLMKQLPVGYYREFNPDSCYRVVGKNTCWLLTSISEKDFPYIDIGYNVQIIREIYAICTNIYFQNRK